MAEEPICGKCGGKRTPMKKGKGKGIWFLGCEKCTGKTVPPKKEEKPGDPPPADKKEHWLDDWF